MSSTGMTDAQRAALDEQKTTFWPTIRASLVDGTSDSSKLEVECPVCYSEIALKRVNNPNVHKLISGEQVVGNVLFCGHIMCQGCLKGHIKATQASAPDMAIPCPVCKEKTLDYPVASCKHVVGGRRLPIFNHEDHSKIPQTANEGGVVSYLPECCLLCLYDIQYPEAFRNHQLEELNSEFARIASSPAGMQRWRISQPDDHELLIFTPAQLATHSVRRWRYPHAVYTLTSSGEQIGDAFVSEAASSKTDREALSARFDMPFM